MPNINLMWLSDQVAPPAWDLGAVFAVSPNPASLADSLSRYLSSPAANAWLFWDSRYPLPASERIDQLLSQPADVWHAGLILGLRGQPPLIDCVAPTWMLNRDPDPFLEATSWRLSLTNCLIRSSVLRHFGAPCPDFASLQAAGLDWGFRMIRLGAFLRNTPVLVQESHLQPPISLSLSDQALFIDRAFGKKWFAWALIRAAFSHKQKWTDLARVWQQISRIPPLTPPLPYQHELTPPPTLPSGTVTVLIPTINRYDYLRQVLAQLRQQTVPPLEILVVDQTPPDARDSGLPGVFPDLPLRWFTRDHAGQCSSRNFGLQKARGDYILFIDDDDEIQPDLIQKHLASLRDLETNISCGVAVEPPNTHLPPDFRFMRVSDVFPTNNTLIRKSVLARSGLFDLAYERGPRADHDLGMRLYLAGERMILDPAISVFHHHAPVGGLRAHKARRKTYAASRKRLFTRHLPAATEIYLAKRYFSDRQVSEMLWISLLGTFSLTGPLWKRVLKVLVALISLPVTLCQLDRQRRIAEQMLKTFPRIPSLFQDPE